MSASFNPSCRHLPPPERLLQSFAALTCLLHRGNDLPVARTTAKIPLQGSLYLCFRWMGVQGEQRLCGHDHSRCAETTLDSSLFDERLLERRRLAALRQPLDRRDGRSFRLHSQHKAAGDRTAVHDDRTGTTLALVAADLGPEKSQVVPQNFGERPAGLRCDVIPVSYTHLRAHETRHDLVCR